MSETAFNEHKPDVPAITNGPLYPGYDYVGARNGVIYLRNKNGVYCVKNNRVIRMGLKFSKDLLASME